MKKKYILVVVGILISFGLLVAVKPKTEYPFTNKAQESKSETKEIDETNKFISFDSSTVKIQYNSDIHPTKDSSIEYMLFDDGNVKFFVKFYSTKAAFEVDWKNQVVDSDGTNAGQGLLLLPGKFTLNGNTYQKLVYYYNPITVTKSGKFDEKISNVMTTQCVSFLVDGGVLAFSSTGGPEGTDACNFVKEHNIKF